MISGLPAGPRRKAFRAFVQAIQSSPGFASGRVVKLWQVWDGKSIATPTAAQMPCVMVRILGGAIDRLATVDDSEATGGLPTVDIRTTPTIVIETWVRGTSVDDAMDLYDLIDAALFPPDADERSRLVDKLRDVGISDWMPMRDILPVGPDDFGADSVHSIGAYQITLDLTQ